MTPLPAHLQDSARISWHLTSWCNYTCEYCGVMVFKKKKNGKDPQPHAFDYYPPARWVEAFASFPQKDLYLKITGGEPFLDRANLKAVLEGLNRDGRYTIRIDTNGSWQPSYFDSVDKKRILLNVSFHPKEVDFPAFLARLEAIRKVGFDVTMVNFVVAPDNLADSERRLRELEDAGFFVNVSAMIPSGVYLDRKVRSPRELELIEENNTPIDRHFRIVNPPTRNRPCLHPALSYYLRYDGGVKVYCTGTYQNIFDQGVPELPRHALPCPFDYCEGCVEMYRALVDEPLVTRPLTLYPLDEYVGEVRDYRRRARWKRGLRRLLSPFGRKARNGAVAAPVLPVLPDAGEADPEIAGYIDPPAGQTSIPGRSGERLLVMGWAASMAWGAPVDEVEILVDGSKIASIRDFMDRPDVAQVFGRPDLLNSGWRALVYLPALAPGEHTLSARACARGSSMRSLPDVRLVIAE